MYLVNNVARCVFIPWSARCGPPMYIERVCCRFHIQMHFACPHQSDDCMVNYAKILNGDGVMYDKITTTFFPYLCSIHDSLELLVLLIKDSLLQKEVIKWNRLLAFIPNFTGTSRLGKGMWWPFPCSSLLPRFLICQPSSQRAERRTIFTSKLEPSISGYLRRTGLPHSLTESMPNAKACSTLHQSAFILSSNCNQL